MKEFDKSDISSALSQIGKMGVKAMREKTTPEQRREWCSRGGKARKGWRKQSPAVSREEEKPIISQ